VLGFRVSLRSWSGGGGRYPRGNVLLRPVTAPAIEIAPHGCLTFRPGEAHAALSRMKEKTALSFVCDRVTDCCCHR